MEWKGRVETFSCITGTAGSRGTGAAGSIPGAAGMVQHMGVWSMCAAVHL